MAAEEDLRHAAFQRAVKDVRRAAAAAARDVLTDPLLVREAAEIAIEKFEDALLKGKTITDPGAWGFKVGRHEALRLAGGTKAAARLPEPEVAAPDRHERGALLSMLGLGKTLARSRQKLTRHQWEVVQALLQHGTFSAAAKALATDRSNLRKTFQRALGRLSATRK